MIFMQSVKALLDPNTLVVTCLDTPSILASMLTVIKDLDSLSFISANIYLLNLCWTPNTTQEILQGSKQTKGSYSSVLISQYRGAESDTLDEEAAVHVSEGRPGLL